MILQPLEAATTLTEAGFSVIPSLPRSKEIHLAGWPELRLGISDLPNYFSGANQNISINWKTSGDRCALDLDATEAEELAPLLLPNDAPAFGRSGRLRQIVFECPGAQSFRIKHEGETLIELLASGCNSLAPGSTHADGDVVTWCIGRSPHEYSPKKVDFSRLKLFANIIAGATLLLRYWRKVAGQGIRHDLALSISGAMLHAGWEPISVRHILSGIFQTAMDPELKDRINAIDTTISRQKEGKAFIGLPELSSVLPTELTEGLVQFWGLGRDNLPSFSAVLPCVPTGKIVDVGEVVLTWACDVAEEKIQWHWYGLLAGGKITLIAGDPGCGKSTLSSTVAALYSTGAPFPGSTEMRQPMRVLICAAEDGAADTKRPRLTAAGADLSKVAFLDLVQHGEKQRFFTLADIPALDSLLAKHPGEFGLLIIDPIGSYLAGKDSHRDSDIRELLRPLGAMAEQHRIAVLLIAHLNKSSMQTAMNRVTGAKAFVAAARLAWLVAQDPQDPATVLVVQLKTNITERLDGLSYQIAKEVLPSGAEVSKVVWNDLPVKLTADELLQRPPSEAAPKEQEQQAEDWLRQRLVAGPVAVRVLKEEVDLQPFSWATTQRAAKAIYLKGDGEKKNRVWFLPGQVQTSVVPTDLGTHREMAATTPTPVKLEEVPILMD